MSYVVEQDNTSADTATGFVAKVVADVGAELVVDVPGKDSVKAELSADDLNCIRLMLL
jgi:hypothetical protein